MHTARTLTVPMCVCVCLGGASIQGGASFPVGGASLPGGEAYFPGGGYHVTYPIMHLMLPVCCLLTNWDPPTVQLLIYCWLVMWPAWHAGFPPSPWTEFLTHASENITLPQTSFAGGNKTFTFLTTILPSVRENFRYHPFQIFSRRLSDTVSQSTKLIHFLISDLHQPFSLTDSCHSYGESL